MDWHKISGGGTSSAGNFSVSGTIGQHDASANDALNGGNFSLTGGLWSLTAVQTPGAPLLTIYLAAANSAVIAWPASPGGFVLQENSSLATPNWIAATNAVSAVNGTNQITLLPPQGNKFYRLFHP